MADGSLSRKRTGDGDYRPVNRLRRNSGNPEFVDGYFEADETDADEIKVMTLSGKIITLEVNGSMSIGMIKSKIQAVEHIPFDQQELAFDKKVLEDMNTLANLGIKKNSTLTLLPKSTGSVTIFVNAHPKIYSYRAQVKLSDTIKSLKARIKHHKDDGLLMFNETVLEDSRTLAEFNIVNGSVLTLAKMEEISVNTFTGNTVTLLYNPKQTISDVKLAIWEEVDIAVDKQVLMFNDTVLEDSGTLADFNIVNKSVLTCIGKADRTMEIFVDFFSGKTISLLVSPTDTIADVKSEIQDKERIAVDEQLLIFNKMVLGDNGTLFDFYVNRKSTLTLMRKPKPKAFIRVFVKTFKENDIITLEVKPSETIHNVKLQIFDKINVPHDEQELTFNGKFLHNINTLADYNIKKKSMLTLMRVSSGSMHIFIKTLTGKTVTFKVKPSTTVRKVKSKIHEIEDVPTINQILYFKEKQLWADVLTLADYGIHDGSTVHLAFRVGGGIMNEGVTFVCGDDFVV